MPYSPKISIITPSFNQGRYIEQTIDSVLSQNYPNVEYIIIDGGSTDNTIEIIRKYEKHLAYWVSEPDRGQSHAINKGFEKASGDIINWLNSDDWYQPGAFMHLAHLAAENTDAHVFACNERRIYPDGNKEILSTPVFQNLNDAFFYHEIDQPATFFRKRIWDQIFPINEELHYIMDGELWLRYILQYGYKYVVKSEFEIVNFRVHHNSKTTLNQINNGFVKDRATIMNTLMYQANFPPELIHLVLKYYYTEPEPKFLQSVYKISAAHRQSFLKYLAKKAAITAIHKHENKEARIAAKLLLAQFSHIFFALNIIRKTL